MADPEYFKRPPKEMADDQNRFETLEKELETAYETWARLETDLEGMELD